MTAVRRVGWLAGWLAGWQAGRLLFALFKSANGITAAPPSYGFDRTLPGRRDETFHIRNGTLRVFPLLSRARKCPENSWKTQSADSRHREHNGGERFSKNNPLKTVNRPSCLHIRIDTPVPQGRSIPSRRPEGETLVCRKRNCTRGTTVHLGRNSFVC